GARLHGATPATHRSDSAGTVLVTIHRAERNCADRHQDRNEAGRRTVRMTWRDDRAKLAGSLAADAGGAGGLGSAISKDLVDAGVRVAVLDRDEQACATIRAELGPDSFVQVGDARKPETLDEFFGALDDRWAQ